MTLRRLAAAPLAAALLALPSLAQACSACGVGNGRNATAYLLTTVFLSLLPLGFIAGVIVWLVRNGREFIRGEFRESDEAVPAPATSPEGGSASG